MIKDIENFGAIDAESDNRLKEYFCRTNIIDKLLNNEKNIVIGRKGSGKTAIYKHIAESRRNFAVELSFKDYPWKVHDLFKNHEVSERESFLNSWTYLFYIEILKQCVKQKQNFQKPKQKEIRKIEKWLRRNWGAAEFSHSEIISPKRKQRFWNFSFSRSILGTPVGAATESTEETRLGGTLTEWNKKLEKIVSELMTFFNDEIILLFDELDLAYDNNDPNYNSRLIGLLLAVRHFHTTHADRIKTILFLRNDIFNNLEFQDKNKIKDNLVEFLDWDKGDSGSQLNLEDIVFARIKNNIASDTSNFKELWELIFDNSIVSRKQLPWSYMISRTFLRPRDVIKFMNLSLFSAKQRLTKEPTSTEKITSDDILKIRKDYSTYLFEELKDETSTKYKQFNDYMEILRDVHKTTFDLNTFKSSYDVVNNRTKFDDSADVILERLYEFSVISFFKSGGGGTGGSEWRFQYHSDYQAFNPQALKFKVHAGFKEYLELVE